MANHLPKKYKEFNHFELLELLENVESKSEAVKKTIKCLCQKDAIIIYKNKIRLFERLKNVCDCKICFEERLNIDLTCGHEVCFECYKKVYEKDCPWCRIPSYFNNSIFSIEATGQNTNYDIVNSRINSNNIKCNAPGYYIAADILKINLEIEKLNFSIFPNCVYG
jgi:hypothetical protein